MLISPQWCKRSPLWLHLHRGTEIQPRFNSPRADPGRNSCWVFCPKPHPGGKQGTDVMQSHFPLSFSSPCRLNVCQAAFELQQSFPCYPDVNIPGFRGLWVDPSLCPQEQSRAEAQLEFPVEFPVLQEGGKSRITVPSPAGTAAAPPATHQGQEGGEAWHRNIWDAPRKV